MIRKRAVWVAVLFSLCAAGYGLVPPAGAQATVSWTPASPMHKARSYFAQVELLNGDILVAGGFDGGTFTRCGLVPPVPPGPPFFANSEIYELQTGTWRVVAPMNQGRAAAVAVRLEDGRVLVIGGYGTSFTALSSAEIYDPSTDTWTMTGSMNEARAEDFIAVLLPGRRVLVAGGSRSDFSAISSAEIYDEASGTWTPTASMHDARGEFTGNSIVLQDGRVLAIGGFEAAAAARNQRGNGGTASAEIYDPATGLWTLTGSMNNATCADFLPLVDTCERGDFAAALLLDGRVLVAGGEVNQAFPRRTSAEIYDPQTGQWSSTGAMTSQRSEMEYASVLLPDGRVLVPGGFTGPEAPQSSADLYDPQTGTWTQAGFMSVPRAAHAAFVLRGGRGVLVMGGLTQPPCATNSVDLAVFDLTPPTTTASISPQPNAAGWNNSDVTIALTAVDNPGGSGVAQITYSATGAQTLPSTAVGSASTSFSLSAEGVTTITFFSTDNAGNVEAPNTLTIKLDKTPPEVTCAVTPNVLWPPNHQMVPVNTSVTVADALSGPAGFSLLAVTSSEPADATGSGNTSPDIQGWGVGTPSTSGQLRAERSGGGSGRAYAITYKGMDLAGNSATCGVMVTVPHDQGNH